MSAGKFSIFAAGNAGDGLPTITSSDPGKVISVNTAAAAFELSWPDDALNNFFVSRENGVDDSNHGKSKNAPFKTLRFAMGYINNNVTDDSAAHVEVSEGKYDYEVAETNKVKEGLIKLATINQPINTKVSTK